MTHQSVEGSAAAVPADLVRLSCGVEAADDLVEDLRAGARSGVRLSAPTPPRTRRVTTPRACGGF